MNHSDTPPQQPHPRPLHTPLFWLISIIVGFVAGLGAVLFRGLIAVLHNIFFLGQFSFSYNANIHTPSSPWGAWIIVVPIIGALIVAFLVKTFAPEAKGHGVPEVMEAVYFKEGIIRPVVAVIKAIASALSIGTGGSVGREGPIVQIGSSFGSTLGQILRLPARQRITLVAAGAGGGIAATFNTPIGGILFAAELLLPEISAWTLIPVAISTATATYLGRLLLGANPSFVIPSFETPDFHATNPVVLIACIVLGVLLGLVSAGFIHAIYKCEDFFDHKIFRSYYIRHLLGMTLVGVLIWLTQRNFHHYYIQGVGYAMVQDLLTGDAPAIGILLLLFLLKIIVTSLTLGSGGSGGIFSPSLFLGAAFGAAYGLILQHLFPHLPISPPAFAVVGMAGVVGSVTGAAITAIVMIFEMTLDYQMILPMTLTVAISYGIRKFLINESIYTLKLTRRRLPMPESLEANTWLVRQARDYMDTRFRIVPVDTTWQSLADIVSEADFPPILLIEDAGQVIGILETNQIPDLIDQKHKPSLKEASRTHFEVVDEHTVLFELASRSHAANFGHFLVASEDDTRDPLQIKGVVSKQLVIDIVFESIAVRAT